MLERFLVDHSLVPGREAEMPDIETPVIPLGLKAKLDLMNGFWLISGLRWVELSSLDLGFDRKYKPGLAVQFLSLAQCLP